MNETKYQLLASFRHAEIACGVAVTDVLGKNGSSVFWKVAEYVKRGSLNHVKVSEIARIASDPKRFLVMPDRQPLTTLRITNLRLLALVLTRASARPMNRVLGPISIHIEEFTLLERAQLGSGDPLDLTAFINSVRSTAAPDSVLSMKTRVFQKDNIDALAAVPIEAAAMDVSDQLQLVYTQVMLAAPSDSSNQLVALDKVVLAPSEMVMAVSDEMRRAASGSDKLVLAYLVTPMKTAQNESVQIVPFAYLYSDKQLGIKWFADSAMRSKETSYIFCLLDIEQQYFGPAYHEEFVAIFAKHPELIFELHDKESGLSQQYITMETFRAHVMENIRFLFQERARHFMNSMLAKLACPRQYVQNFPLYHPDDRERKNIVEKLSKILTKFSQNSHKFSVRIL